MSSNALIDLFLEMSDPEKNRELPRDLDLLTLVTSPDFGQLTGASPAQRLLMLAADGKPANDILPPDRMLFHVGAERLPSGRPRLVVLRTGVRAGKSLIAALALLHSALTCKFRRDPNPEAGELPGPDGKIGIMEGEFVRALIVAPKLKMSRAPLIWIKSRMEHSPILKKYIVKVKEESIVVRRPDGAEVTIEIVAADSGGGNLRSTWLAGILFDEAAFHDGDDGAVNLAENYRAAAPRLLPGAQAWIVSSPWSDDDPFNTIFTQYFGKPGHQLAFHSDTRSMNPALEQSVIDEERARDPDNAAREYDAVPLSSSSTAFFPPDAIEKSINHERPIYLPPLPGVEHKAGSDLAFRKNSSALAISRAAKCGDPGRETVKAQLAYHEEKRPPKGASLRPSEVIIDFAKRCKEYRARKMMGDHWSRDTADEELAKLREKDRAFDIVYEPLSQQADDIGDRFAEFRRRMQEGLVELPNEPVLLKQIRDTKSRAAPGGKIHIQVPKHGMTHGDVMVAAVNSIVQVDLTVRSGEKKPMTRGRREMNDTGGF